MTESGIIFATHCKPEYQLCEWSGASFASYTLKTEGGQINVGHLHFIFNYCFIIVT